MTIKVAILGSSLALACSVLAQEPSFLYTIHLDGSTRGLQVYAPAPPEGDDGWGPQGLSANDRGEVAIIDILPKAQTQVKIFNLKGDLLRVLKCSDPALPMGWLVQMTSIALGNNGTLFALLSGMRENLVCFDEDGSIRWRLSVAGPLTGALPMGLRARNDGSVAVDFGGDEPALIISGIGNAQPHPGAHYLSPTTSRSGIAIERTGFRGRKLISDGQGGPTIELRGPIEDESDPGLGSIFLDASGYVTSKNSSSSKYPRALQTGNKTTVDRIITRFSPTGEAIVQLRLPGPPSNCYNGDAAVSPMGDIYTLLYDWDRVHVVRYALSQIRSGFMALDLMPTLTIAGHRFVPLGAVAKSSKRKAILDAKTRMVKVGDRQLALSSGEARIVRGRTWITAKGAAKLGLPLWWDRKGIVAYTRRTLLAKR